MLLRLPLFIIHSILSFLSTPDILLFQTISKRVCGIFGGSAERRVSLMAPRKSTPHSVAFRQSVAEILSHSERSAGSVFPDEDPRNLSRWKNDNNLSQHVPSGHVRRRGGGDKPVFSRSEETDLANELRGLRKVKGKVTLRDVRRATLKHAKRSPRPPTGCRDAPKRAGFVASPGWCSKFRKKHRFKPFRPKVEVHPPIEGSAALQSMVDAAQHFWRVVYKLRREFTVGQIINVDEMPLGFDRNLDRVLEEEESVESFCPSLGDARMYLTLVVGGGADGTKLILLFIFKGEWQLPARYDYTWKEGQLSRGIQSDSLEYKCDVLSFSHRGGSGWP
jgi:hypothetical protein